MKRKLALMGITFAACSLAFAQESGDRVVIPARNSTRPRKLDISLMNGSVTVKAYNGKDVIVETTRAGRRAAPETVNGMHRLDLGSRGLSIEEQDNVITIRTRAASPGGVVISTPADTSLAVRTMSGAIDAEGLTGEFDVQTHNGVVTLANVSGTVVAHSLNGAIRVTMDRVDENKPLSFSTLNGPIDVTLPANLKANLKLNTNHGEIWTDFDVKLSGGAVTQQNNTADGKYRVDIDRSISGTINGGGVEATFHTFNGKISIKKK